MKKVKIEQDINDESYINSKTLICEIINDLSFKHIKISAYSLMLLFIVLIIGVDKFYYKNIIDLTQFKKFVRDCKNSIIYDRIKIYNKNPYITVCMSALNMENYIKKNLLSIINQSFQDFQIIVINDKSTDETENIIKILQLEDDRIKIISHSENLGVYRSRMESILNSNSEFILLMDPDDMYLNPNLLKELNDYNIKNNLDIIEFVVYQQFDGRNKIFYPNNDYETHFHKFKKDIIYQPELSELLYYTPGTNEYSHTICRNIWNKMIRKNIYIKTYNFIGKEYFNDFVITADDMIMNIISYQYANNYTNINIPGYLYIIRKVSMSRGDGGEKLMKIRALNHLSYFKLFYKYLKEYNKDRNYLYYEMKDLHRFILYMKKTNLNNQIQEIKFIKEIMKDKNITKEYKDYLDNLLLYFLNK